MLRRDRGVAKLQMDAGDDVLDGCPFLSVVHLERLHDNADKAEALRLRRHSDARDGASPPVAESHNRRVLEVDVGEDGAEPAHGRPYLLVRDNEGRRDLVLKQRREQTLLAEDAEPLRRARVYRAEAVVLPVRRVAHTELALLRREDRAAEAEEVARHLERHDVGVPVDGALAAWLVAVVVAAEKGAVAALGVLEAFAVVGRVDHGDHLVGTAAGGGGQPEGEKDSDDGELHGEVR